MWDSWRWTRSSAAVSSRPGVRASTARWPKAISAASASIALKPMTFMNESSKAVGEAVRFLKVPLDRLVVFHDELDIAPGRVRMKKGGGAGGHNGLRDIDAHVGKDYRRVRIGIGHPGHKDLVLHWVLRDFEPRRARSQGRLAAEAAERAGRGIGAAGRRRRQGRRKYMSRVAHLAPPPDLPARSGHLPKSRKRKMGFNCGIVGLPNVGKSTLFNALTATQAAQAANYPFCTIEPNVGRVAVPDPRLDKLAAIASSAKIINTQLEFVDIAGLVKGASKGEGPRQPVPRQHPRGRRHRPRAALLRGRRRHPRLGQRRSGARCRGRRDRADAGRPRQPREAPAQPREARQGRRQGSRRRGAGREEGARRACATASRPARPSSPTTSAGLRPPAAHHRQADDVRAERRGGLGRHRQRAQRQGRGLRQDARHAVGRDLGRHRGRGGAAPRRGPGRLPLVARPRRRPASPASCARATRCSTS